MNENEKVIPAEETEETKVTFGEKAKAFWIKNRKKFVLGASALAAIGAAMVMRKRVSSDDTCDDEAADTETDEVYDDTPVEE